MGRALPLLCSDKKMDDAKQNCMMWDFVGVVVDITQSTQRWFQTGGARAIGAGRLEV